ncbi:chorismate synthase [Parablautia sp. Marseille-Q6255]|uniref:chorismate synthase n=1 Tax=Parablautia sp. Marseille-Q6255 TaxID=3039593 RepID=UPI0024BD52D0|nr:chorismate synthase [Parablautia sp. Marseille-Q6255]
MAGSSFGTIFRVTTWGESHGKAIGAVVDGCPAGISLCEADIQTYLDRRRPGQNKYTTSRAEADAVQILSGVFEGKTTGTPISLMVLNQDQRSKDYGTISELYRPGHADYTFDQKYGFRDYRGGGRSSGRETIGRVAAGAIACRMLDELGIRVRAYVSQIGPVSIDRSRMDLDRIEDSPVRMPDPQATRAALSYLDACIHSLDSSGGTIECSICGLPAGLGEPVFDKLDASLAKAVMSIGAVKAVEIGDGVQAAMARGSQNNDAYTCGADGTPTKATNHSGGILGGISDGTNVLLRASFKPTPSIARPQSMLGRDGACHEAVIHGRHDPIIVARACVVVEAMAALTIADHLLLHMSSRIDFLKKIYQK